MPNDPDYQADTDDQPVEQAGQNESTPKWRQDLERRAVDGDRAKEQLAQAQETAKTAQKEAALLKLGIDPESKQGQLLIRVHGDGDPTADAFRNTATQYDLIPQSNATPDNEAAAQRMQEVGQGGAPPAGDVSEWEKDLAAIPQYGKPGWEQGKEQALELLRKHGGQVTETRPKQVKMFDLNGRPTGQKDAVSPRY